MKKTDDRIVKTFDSDRETEIVQESNAKADLQEKHTIKVPLAPYKAVAMRAESALATTNISLSRNGDRSATKLLKGNIVNLKMMNKKNGEYYEEKAIETSNPVLITDLGYRFYKIPVSSSTASGTKAENTDVEGELFVSTDPVSGAKCYKVEGKISGTDIPIKFDPIVVPKGQTVNNFISGELYLIRTCSVDSKGNDGVWTDYFEIRIK